MADPAKVFDIEAADKASAGCAAHADPACLCDVDVSKTADIEWNRAPIEFLHVETAEDLVQTWASYVYLNEIEPHRTLEAALLPNERPWNRYVGARYRQGAMPFTIWHEVKERWGVEPSLKSIQTMCMRHGRAA